MKKGRINRIGGVAVGCLAVWGVVGGCTFRTYNVSKPDPVVVKTAPPEPKPETTPESPGEKHVWKAGAWEWDDKANAWQWESGSWVVPPSGYVWETAAYEPMADGAVRYTPGHWVERKKSTLKGTENRREDSTPAEEKKSKPARKGGNQDPGTVAE